MAGGYTNLDKVRVGGYRRFVDDAATTPPPPLQQIPTDSEDEEEAPPSYQRGGGPVFFPAPPSVSGPKSPTHRSTASPPIAGAGDGGRKNLGEFKFESCSTWIREKFFLLKL